jgi:GGDEF domain-containing protein
VRNALKRSTQDTLTNPVTGLPEGTVVDERLNECLSRETWGLLSVSLLNVDRFRDAYGFVASDDVMRAVSMMIHNAMRELGINDGFLGQVAPNVFIAIVSPASMPAFEERIHSRLEQSLDYFYPIRDRDQMSRHPDKLAVRIGKFEPGESFEGLVQFKDEILRRKSI